MERKVAKRTSAKKPKPQDEVSDAGLLELDGPFSEAVAESESVPAKKKPAKKAVAKKKSVKTVDPFAEIATEKPVKVRVIKAKPSTRKTATSAVAEKPAKKKKAVSKPRAKKVSLDVTPELAATTPEVELSPVFKALADVSLPELKRENRARLLMQSPTKLYFYWSLGENPWHQLRQAFGNDEGSYTLVLKLTNSVTGSEDLYPVEAEGEWWFDVDSGGTYRAEIGFYAPNRPYFRIVYSNVVETPRRSPSPHPSSDARWTVSATKFAEVLDVSGFASDAFDVAMAGDDPAAAGEATRSAFVRLTGSESGIGGVSAEDVRHALVAIAGGTTIEELRPQIGASLFATLQANADKITAGGARSALGEYFDVDQDEWTEYETGSGVFGASLVHFPKTLKTRKAPSRYNPLASHSVLS